MLLLPLTVVSLFTITGCNLAELSVPISTKAKGLECRASSNKNQFLSPDLNATIKSGTRCAYIRSVHGIDTEHMQLSSPLFIQGRLHLQFQQLFSRPMVEICNQLHRRHPHSIFGTVCVVDFSYCLQTPVVTMESQQHYKMR